MLLFRWLQNGQFMPIVYYNCEQLRSLKLSICLFEWDTLRPPPYLHTLHRDLFINYFIKPCCSADYTKVNSCPLSTVSVNNCVVWSYLDVYLNGTHSDLFLRWLGSTYKLLHSFRSIHSHCLLYLWTTVKFEVIWMFMWMGHTQTSSLGAHSSFIYL